MKAFLTLGSVLLATMSLSAQSSTSAASASASPAIANAIVSGQNCPVALVASRDPDGGLVQTSPASRHRGQGLRLYFTPIDPHSISEADFIVHGMIGAQVIPAGPQTLRDATEDFHVLPTSGEDRRFTSTVYMKRLTGIDYIELNTIKFADGTQWHTSAKSTCRVTPSGFKLVASGQ